MKAKTKLCVVLSDLHVGSTVGLWPPGFVANEGFAIGQNPFQSLLWQHWVDCTTKWIPRVVGDDEFDLVLNGDLVDGIHHRTLQVMSADVADQTAAVLEVLRPLTDRAAALYLTKGTECHTRNDELRIGKELGARRDPSTGHHAWDRLELEFGKIVIAASHHTPTTSRPYLEASQHSIQLGAEIMERARNGKKIPRIILRAHRHLPGIWNDGRLISVTTGAWQGLTRYGRKVVPHAVPAPSCAVLDFRNAAPGELPSVHQKTWITE